MTNPDFEKTQIWAKSLVNAPAVAPPPVAAAAPVMAMPVVPKKPALKKLSKEEKIVLASGGALAIGLGAIVITSLPNEAVAATPAIAPETTDLTAPILDLDTEPEVPLPSEPIAPSAPPRPRAAAPHQPATRPEVPPAAPPSVPEEHHALLEIPDIPEVATTVGDDLPFLEAFHTARAEVGPAGLFAWRGTFYSTFTETEWDTVPEDQKQHWLEGAEPIIHPGYENLQNDSPDLAAAFQHVIVAERGELVWTGIDKNGDGQVEVLMGRINGQSPMVLMDTDGDGILDTRYDLEAKSGKTFASQIEPFSMSATEIEHIEFVPIEADMGFYNAGTRHDSHEVLPVSIHQEAGQYVVTLDSDRNNTIDAITFLTDEKGPVVGLDFDNDGQIEMGFSYDSETHSIVTVEVEPLEEMKVGEDEIPQFSYAEDDALLNNYDPEAETDELAFDDEPDTDSDSTFQDGYDDHDHSLFS
ncbi:hypothetical protein [Salmonirosea aquatica]|uniref:Uncharacterized protein n=1 Tax=Salmonirosea aquatica TaxID=2654236 RepID=A0A7C9BHL8_9BACT|nr:hypothetical protein [Cytophagaceae bacterium SJW1-29]